METTNLSPTYVRRLLKCVNPLSLWGMAIHDALKKGADLDQLIIELRSQAKDNPQSMREMLGSVIYEKLILTN